MIIVSKKECNTKAMVRKISYIYIYIYIYIYKTEIIMDLE